MFTVKQVTRDGAESFWAATNVRVAAAHNGPQLYDDRTIYFDMPQPTGETIIGSVDNGYIYIMNASGKTIDRYILGDQSPVPGPGPELRDVGGEHYLHRPAAETPTPNAYVEPKPTGRIFRQNGDVELLGRE